MKLYTDIFSFEIDDVPIHENEGLFYWAYNFYNRHIVMSEATLIPILGDLRHKDLSPCGVDYFHKKLHIADNKIYKHPADLDGIIAELSGEEGDRFYDESERMMYNVGALYE